MFVRAGMWLYTRLTTSVPLSHLSRDQLAYPVVIQANLLSTVGDGVRFKLHSTRLCTICATLGFVAPQCEEQTAYPQHDMKVIVE
jgi:hypothetical protein